MKAKPLSQSALAELASTFTTSVYMRAEDVDISDVTEKQMPATIITLAAKMLLQNWLPCQLRVRLYYGRCGL